MSRTTGTKIIHQYYNKLEHYRAQRIEQIKHHLPQAQKLLATTPYKLARPITSTQYTIRQPRTYTVSTPHLSKKEDNNSCGISLQSVRLCPPKT